MKSRTGSLVSRLVAVTGSLAVGMGLLATPALAAEGPDLDEPYGWVEEFDSWEALDGWNIFNQPDYNNDDALYTRDALTVVDGQLVITTRRHCVDEDIDLHDRSNHHLLTDDNASVAPCADDEYEKFTSGRLQSPDIARGEFDVSVTASIETGDTRGVRSAIWMQNESAACSADSTQAYGELDLVEHFSHEARSVWSPSNTHLGCRPLGQNGTNNAPRELRVGPEITGETHTWSASTTRDQVAYFFDGEPIDRESWRHDTVLGHAQVDDFNLAQWDYDEILNQNWKLILNQKVENAEWTKPASPDEDFPVRTMTVDRVEVNGTPFTEVASAPNPGERLSSFSS